MIKAMALLDVYNEPKMVVLLILLYALYFSYRINLLVSDVNELKKMGCITSNNDGSSCA